MTTPLRMLLGVGPSTLNRFVPSAISQDGARETLFSGGNIYTPGLVYRDGALYLFYTEGTVEHAAGSSAKMRVSYDLGVTWSLPVVLYAGGGAGRHANVESAFLTSTGRILVALDDQSDSNNLDVKAVVTYSDDGVTWSAPYTVPNSFSGDCVAGEFAELTDGTIVMAIYGEQTGVVGGNTFCRVVFSSDDGATFGTETTLAQSASRTYAEPNIAWVGGSQLVALMRSDTNQHTWRSTSPDGDPWAAATDVLTASGPPDFMEWYADGGYLFAMLRNNNTQFRPRWTTSLDSGATWAALSEVDSGETRELDGTGIASITDRRFITVYALANSLSSSTVYLRRWLIT